MSDGARYSLASEEYPEEKDEFWGYAQDATGLFTPLADDMRRVQLLGCAPQGGLLRSLDHLGGKRATAGRGNLHLLDPSGKQIGEYFLGPVKAEAVRPSARGSGLVDVTVSLWSEVLLPESEWPWELIRTKRLDRPGMWHSLGPAGRLGWLSVALHHSEYRGLSDDPPGTRYELDGEHIVDADSFYCAIGEAVNGPGGFFGWNLGALDDCLCGRAGATPPFTLAWHRSDLARERLTSPVESGGILFDVILEVLRDKRVDVILR